MKSALKLNQDFKCYAPSFLQDPSYFPKENFKEIYELEKGHFWFESRNTIINHFIHKYLGNRNTPKCLEVGCGTGFVLESIANANPTFELEGTELYLEGLRFAHSRSPHLNFFQSDARNLPFKNEYDAIFAFDVIEHIEEDIDTLKSIYKNLKPGGYLIATIPQHMWLWSKHDEYACHKRRYTRKELLQKLTSCQLTPKAITSFVFTLLPAMLLSRLNNTEPSEMSEFKISKITNQIMKFGMKCDEFLIKAGISLPIGGSLIAVAQKNV
ncbi:MAG: class I SAM-dependent methyltransferase [Alphaproteobacteria bacterium]|nr:class I SAM-dependent methyltransferase [Alphaproteobacteria bacterium]